MVTDDQSYKLYFSVVRGDVIRPSLGSNTICIEDKSLLISELL